MRFLRAMSFVISAILGLVSLPAGAEIIKVSISGMYDGENSYGTDVDDTISA
jgi:hypothetical protein